MRNSISFDQCIERRRTSSSLAPTTAILPGADEACGAAGFVDE